LLAARDRAEILDDRDFALHRRTFEARAQVRVATRNRAGHRVNPQCAHRETRLNRLVRDETLFVLLEHQLDVVAVLLDAHHQVIGEMTEARMHLRRLRSAATNAEEELSADLHGRADMRERIRLHLEQVLAELLRAVREDERVHDFVRAFHDDVDARVAPHALNVVLRHVAFAAHALERVVDHAVAEFAAEDLAHRGLEHDVFVVAIEETRRHVEHRVGGVDVRSHARNLLLHEIEFADRAVELVTRLRPLRRLLHRVARCAEHARRERAAAVIQAGERDVEALAFLEEEVLLRNLHVRQLDARLPRTANTALRAVAAEDVDAFHVRRADEGGDRILRLARLGVGDLLLRHHGEEARERARSRPLLLAIEDVVRAVGAEFAARFLAACVATDVWLREAERAERRLCHERQEALLLLVVAEEHDGLAADRLVRRHEHGRRTARTTESLKHAVVACDAEAETAELRRNRHAEHADVEEPLNDPLWDLLLLIDLNRWVLGLQVVVERGEQLIALRGLFGRNGRIRERELLAEVAPEDVLDETHRRRIGAKHFLCLLDLLAILLGDVLQVLGEVGVRHVSLVVVLVRR